MPPEEGDRRKHVRHQSSLEADVSLPTHGHLELIESTHLGNISEVGRDLQVSVSSTIPLARSFAYVFTFQTTMMKRKRSIA